MGFMYVYGLKSLRAKRVPGTAPADALESVLLPTGLTAPLGPPLRATVRAPDLIARHRRRDRPDDEWARGDLVVSASALMFQRHPWRVACGAAEADGREFFSAAAPVLPFIELARHLADGLFEATVTFLLPIQSPGNVFLDEYHGTMHSLVHFSYQMAALSPDEYAQRLQAAFADTPDELFARLAALASPPPPAPSSSTKTVGIDSYRELHQVSRYRGSIQIEQPLYAERDFDYAPARPEVPLSAAQRERLAWMLALDAAPRHTALPIDILKRVGCSSPEGLLRAWAAARPRQGGVVADATGSGKTRTVIEFVRAQRQRNGRADPTLVVVPTNLVQQWADQCATWAPELSVHVVYGPVKRDRVYEHGRHQIVITTYSTLRNRLSPFAVAAPCLHERTIERVAPAPPGSLARPSALLAIRPAIPAPLARFFERDCQGGHGAAPDRDYLVRHCNIKRWAALDESLILALLSEPPSDWIASDSDARCFDRVDRLLTWRPLALPPAQYSAASATPADLFYMSAMEQALENLYRDKSSLYYGDILEVQHGR